ncbi:MAG: FAD-dependent oxidoreductase [Hyphomicrobium sp.]|jgi:phytoene dehydrogenase-like protein
MTAQYDVIVIGAGLGGLTAAALLAQAGRKTLLVERNYGVGGAASTYKAGDLVIEASLHETADPYNHIEPKHHVLSRLGVLDAVEWVPTGAVYEVRGGPVGAPFLLPDGFTAARAALCDRYPSARDGIASVLSEMEKAATGLGVLSQGQEAFRNPGQALSAVMKLGPVMRGWRLSLAERFTRAFGEDEGVKCALAANLPYWHDDPDTLSWVLFAVAQGGYLGCGGRYIQGGSQRLSNAIARALKSAGGELLLRRPVCEILLDGEGRPSGVVHARANGDERVEVYAPVIVSNAAPVHVAEMLPEAARARFWSPYARRPLSISLFSATFGLSVRPAEVGFTSYSTCLLPEWMQALGDYRKCGDLLAHMPAETMPALTIVDYSAIDSGLGGPPYPVAVVGVDKIANWAGLDGAAYEDKRDRWREAVIGTIDREFPGFASHVETAVFSTASTMRSYLNAPDGAIYGFAPLPPSGPIWKGPDSTPNTPIPGLYLASSYAGNGGFTGAILAGATAAERVLKGR